MKFEFAKVVFPNIQNYEKFSCTPLGPNTPLQVF